jgi:hypothetical protein
MANAAIQAALMAAAQQQALASKAITEQLKKAGAKAPRSAAELDLSNKGSDKVLETLIKSGHVRDAGGGRYWLDEDAIAATKASAGRVALILVAFLLSAAASLLAIAAAY